MGTKYIGIDAAFMPLIRLTCHYDLTVRQCISARDEKIPIIWRNKRALKMLATITVAPSRKESVDTILESLFQSAHVLIIRRAK